MSDTVTEVGISAFEGCESLKELKLSKELVSSGEKSFANCKELEKVEIPKSLIDVIDTWDSLYVPQGMF